MGYSALRFGGRCIVTLTDLITCAVETTESLRNIKDTECFLDIFCSTSSLGVAKIIGQTVSFATRAASLNSLCFKSPTFDKFR